MIRDMLENMESEIIKKLVIFSTNNWRTVEKTLSLRLET